jgi:predicted acyl esterase
MRVDWDVPIAMDDGLVLRADVFRPEGAGCGPFLPDGPRDRPASIFGGTTTLHLHDSYVLIPVIP